ncbi:MAG: CopG family transcriptional regulator [Gemmatimonadales bacterium]
MEQQTTFRLPQDLARLLGARARARGVSKSQMVREALERYLGTSAESGAPGRVAESVAAEYLGSLRLDSSAAGQDPFASMIRERNWRG